jgi:predicted nucleic acid-binding protein
LSFHKICFFPLLQRKNANLWGIPFGFSTPNKYPKIKERISPVLAGRFINELRDLSVTVDDLPPVDISPDPCDNYLLSICSGGSADYLITGDKQHLPSLKKFDGTSILSVTDFLKKTRL